MDSVIWIDGGLRVHVVCHIVIDYTGIVCSGILIGKMIIERIIVGIVTEGIVVTVIEYVDVMVGAINTHGMVEHVIGGTLLVIVAENIDKRICGVCLVILLKRNANSRIRQRVIGPFR